MKNINSADKSLKITNTKTYKYVLKESITINQSEALKKDLLSALNRPNTLLIEGKNIKEIDITFIQLMYALKRSSLKLNRKIEFNIELTEELTSLLEHSGFNKLNEILN